MPGKLTSKGFVRVEVLFTLQEWRELWRLKEELQPQDVGELVRHCVSVCSAIVSQLGAPHVQRDSRELLRAVLVELRRLDQAWGVPR